jgi:hypothetical protein
MQSYGKSWYTIHEFAGKTVTWCPSDSEDRFERNMADPKQRAMLERYGWTKDNISYTFNKDGFRSEEFTYEPNDSVLFLGCSHTVGIGVDLESSWTHKVASSLGLRHYNLGIGAGSSDTCFRLAHHWIPRLRPKYVMMLTPESGRMELFEDKNIIKFIPSMTQFNHTNHVTAMIEGFYTNWLTNPANSELNRLKNVMGVRTICNSIGAPLVEIPIDDMYNPYMIQTMARDLMHPGKDWNERVAERFLTDVHSLRR